MNLPKSFPDTIDAIYFIANSPLPLYGMMRENYFIQAELSTVPTSELIKEFYQRAQEKSVKKSKDIAELYAILIALSFKERAEVKDFFNEVSKINFEWFSDIAKYYLNNEEAPVLENEEVESASTNDVRIEQLDNSTTTQETQEYAL